MSKQKYSTASPKVDQEELRCRDYRQDHSKEYPLTLCSITVATKTDESFSSDTTTVPTVDVSTTTTTTAIRAAARNVKDNYLIPTKPHLSLPSPPKKALLQDHHHQGNKRDYLAVRGGDDDNTVPTSTSPLLPRNLDYHHHMTFADYTKEEEAFGVDCGHNSDDSDSTLSVTALDDALHDLAACKVNLDNTTNSTVVKNKSSISALDAAGGAEDDGSDYDMMSGLEMPSTPPSQTLPLPPSSPLPSGFGSCDMLYATPNRENNHIPYYCDMFGDDVEYSDNDSDAFDDDLYTLATSETTEHHHYKRDANEEKACAADDDDDDFDYNMEDPLDLEFNVDSFSFGNIMGTTSHPAKETNSKPKPRLASFQILASSRKKRYLHSTFSCIDTCMDDDGFKRTGGKDYNHGSSTICECRKGGMSGRALRARRKNEKMMKNSAATPPPVRKATTPPKEKAAFSSRKRLDFDFGATSFSKSSIGGGSGGNIDVFPISYGANFGWYGF